MLPMIFLIPIGFAVIVGVLPIWALITAMVMMMSGMAIYVTLWFKMLNKMKESPQDRKFVNKMIQEEYW